MKKFLNTLFFGKYSALAFAAVAAVASLLDYSFRFSFVFIDNSVFSGFSLILFIVSVLAAAFLTAAASLKMRNSHCCDKKWFKAIQCISVIYTVFMTIVVLISFITAGSESSPVALTFCKQLLPLWVAIVAVAFVSFILPNIKKSAVKKVFSAVIAVALAVVIYSSVFPVTPYKFTSAPVVFDNGEDYSVVFTTSDIGTAYVEYEYNGKNIRIFDENNGRKNGDSIIHTIHVPYEQLSGNTYKVFSTRVIDELSYGGRSGKTIESESINFSDNLGKNVNALTVSDWHTRNELAKKAVAQVGDYNAVLLVGDCAPGLMVPEDVEKYLIQFAADLSKGTMPVIFARGNHETRGKEACKLADYLGMDKFYFTTKLGDYNFIVLDSGEDKNDDHPEYGGMVAYEQHIEKMVEWLNGLENQSGSKTIAISHSDEICIEQELSKSALSKLDKMNVSLLVSGHLHKNEIRRAEPFSTLIDGGINAAGKDTYVASMLNITPDGIKVISVDTDGKTTAEDTFDWR